MDPKTTGLFISELRKERGLTQKQMAEKLNVSDKAVSRWETGKGYPDIETLSAISDEFGVSINEILIGERFLNVGQNQQSELDIAKAYIIAQKKIYRRNIILAVICTPIVIINLLWIGFFVYGIIDILFITHYPSDWQRVNINASESVAVPQGWILTDKDGLLYFSDKPLDDPDRIVFMFQSYSDCGYEDDLEVFPYEEIFGKEETNCLCNSFRPLYYFSSEGFSNGTMVCEVIAHVDGNKETMLKLSTESGMIFYVWGNNVDMDTLEMIAQSVDLEI